MNIGSQGSENCELKFIACEWKKLMIQGQVIRARRDLFVKLSNPLRQRGGGCCQQNHHLAPGLWHAGYVGIFGGRHQGNYKLWMLCFCNAWAAVICSQWKVWIL